MRINYNCPDELLAKIDNRAKELSMNRSAYMNMAIARQIESEEALKNLPYMLETINRALDESRKITEAKKK